MDGGLSTTLGRVLERISRRTKDGATTFFVKLYLFGVLLSLYPSTTLRVDGMVVMRMDWLLSLPLFTFVLLYRRENIYALRYQVPRPLLFAAGFVLVLVVSLLINRIYSMVDAATFMIQILYSVSVFAMIVLLKLDRKQLSGIYRFWVGLLVITALYGIYQSFALNHGLPFADPTLGEMRVSTSHGYRRPMSLFVEPRRFAAFLLSGIAITTASAATQNETLAGRRYEIGALTILTTALVFAGSFAGYLSLAGLIFVGLIFPMTRRFTAKFGASIMAALVLIFAAGRATGWDFARMIIQRTNRFGDLIVYVWHFISDAIQGLTGGVLPESDTTTPTETPTPGQQPTATPEQTVTETETSADGFAQGGGSFQTRLSRLLAALRAWRTNILVGVGPHQYDSLVVARDFASKGPFGEVTRVDSIHNYWAQVLAASGLVGFTTVLGVWGSVLYRLREQWAKLGGQDESLATIGVLVIASQAIDGFWGIGIVHPYRWMFLGLVCSHLWGLRKSTSGS